MTTAQETAHHVSAHPAKTDHTHLHRYRSLDHSSLAGEALE
jgi:hypothetical protein